MSATGQSTSASPVVHGRAIARDDIVRLQLHSVEDGYVHPDRFSVDGEAVLVRLPVASWTVDMLEKVVRDLRELDRLNQEGKL